jgi:hypothetical protein
MRRRCSLVANGRERNCPDATQFRCENKCISKHRLVDYLQDCHNDIDETYNNSCALNHEYRVLCILERRINGPQCLPPTFTQLELKDDCETKVHLPHFPTLCDGYVDYTEKVKGKVETDETNCEQWQCDNQYTRCDGTWNCPNGADEARCLHSICNETYGHPCILPNTTELICLPISMANNGIIDCLGATDERHFCKQTALGNTGYRCFTNSTDNKHIANE